MKLAEWMDQSKEQLEKIVDEWDSFTGELATRIVLKSKKRKYVLTWEKNEIEQLVNKFMQKLEDYPYIYENEICAFRKKGKHYSEAAIRDAIREIFK